MPRPPNIVLMLCDNQRLDTVGMLGRTACRTPTWDRVAGEGAFFDNLRTTCPMCAPARASIFTGLQPQQTGVATNFSPVMASGDGRVRADVHGLARPPLSHHLRGAGYHCLYAGKWHLGTDNIHDWFDVATACDHTNRDYSEWCRAQGIPDGRVFHDPQGPRARPYRSRHYPHMTVPHTGVLDFPADKEFNRWVLDHAFEQLGIRRRDAPFFLVVSFEGPHPPFMVPAKYHDLVDAEAIDRPGNWEPSDGEPSFLEGSYYRRLRNEWGRDFDAWRKPTAVYWGFVTYIDHLFGRFVARLEEEGLRDDTLLVMLSDHGEMMGQHGLWQKFCPYEEALRVPWAMRWPGMIEPGTRCDADVSHVDVAATLLDAGGVDVEALALEGRSLLPSLTRREPLTARDCFSQYNVVRSFEEGWHGVENWRLIYRNPWKLAFHENGEREFYHLENDPLEQRNLADDKDARDIRGELEAALLAWCRRTGDSFSPATT
jgi:arylsulfatase A-like enzyme